MDLTTVAGISTYGIYHEAVHGKITEPIPLIWNTLSKLLIDMPFDWFRGCASFVSFLTDALNISGSLGGLQHQMMTQAKEIFVGFIGGKNGTIAAVSGAGMLLTLAFIYLFYQYANGKGRFLHAFFHLMGVVMTLFCFFGTFTYTAQNGQVKREMGGEILFHTVSNVSNEVKNKINAGLTGYTGLDEQGAGFIENYVVKPTANFINTGNPGGKIGEENGKPIYFDYDVANGNKTDGNGWPGGKKGQTYINEVSQKVAFLKNDGKNIGQQMMALMLGQANLLLYAFPIGAVNIMISVLTLVLCLFILLIPVSALLSFIPWCRNAFYSIVKKCLGLLVAPSLLSAMLGVVFYIMMRIDFAVISVVSGHPTNNLSAALTTLSASLFMVFMPAVILLKVVFLYFLWKSKSSLTRTVTGQDMPQQMGLSALQSEWAHMKAMSGKAKNKVVGGAEVAAGAASGQPEVALDGASKLSASDAQAPQQEEPPVETPQAQDNLEPDEIETPEEENLEELPMEDLEDLSSENENPENPEDLQPEDLSEFISEDEDESEETQQPEAGEDFALNDEEKETLDQEENQNAQEEPVDTQDFQAVPHQELSALDPTFATQESSDFTGDLKEEQDIAWEDVQHDLEEMRN
ncbi:hypothetical protein [uncultured Lactococcus sp.]|uniref:hypothetical protein n=1 Tax=uncultured Lactococcus sp. TaxID=167973 RepID=UPI0027DE9C0D|nr:hypothetical protein [uncultured Lactococcus sp.]